jgi:hypothetical protein
MTNILKASLIVEGFVCKSKLLVCGVAVAAQLERLGNQSKLTVGFILADDL